LSASATIILQVQGLIQQREGTGDAGDLVDRRLWMLGVERTGAIEGALAHGSLRNGYTKRIEVAPWISCRCLRVEQIDQDGYTSSHYRGGGEEGSKSEE